MNADEAATLVAKLRPAAAVPIHGAFHGGWFPQAFVLSCDGTPARFAQRVTALRPVTHVRMLPPGQRFTIAAPKTAAGRTSDGPR